MPGRVNAFGVLNRIFLFVQKSQIANHDKLVKIPNTVMPDLIPVEDGIFDRHPESTVIAGFRLSPE
jgi:hypothetical protein